MEYKYPEVQDLRGLRDYIADYIRQRSLISLDLKVRLSGEPVDIRLIVVVHQGHISQTLRLEIESWIHNQLTPYEKLLSFGDDIHSDLLAPITKITGVRHIQNCLIYDHIPRQKGWNIGGGVARRSLRRRRYPFYYQCSRKFGRRNKKYFYVLQNMMQHVFHLV